MSTVIAEDLANYLDAHINELEKILLHGFSGGGYLWGETLLKLNNKLNCKLIKNKIIGQIWDSVTPAKVVPEGLGYVLAPNNRFIKLVITYFCWLILTILYVPTRYYHGKACNFFLTHPVKAPALLFYSKNDELGAYEHNQCFEVNLKKQNIEVKVQCWEDCAHIGHFVRYRQEYTTIWIRFLEKIKF